MVNELACVMLSLSGTTSWSADTDDPPDIRAGNEGWEGNCSWLVWAWLSSVVDDIGELKPDASAGLIVVLS
jgi:hypothetical protein